MYAKIEIDVSCHEEVAEPLGKQLFSRIWIGFHCRPSLPMRSPDRSRMKQVFVVASGIDVQPEYPFRLVDQRKAVLLRLSEEMRRDHNPSERHSTAQMADWNDSGSEIGMRPIPPTIGPQGYFLLPQKVFRAHVELGHNSPHHPGGYRITSFFVVPP